MRVRGLPNALVQTAPVSLVGMWMSMRNDWKWPEADQLSGEALIVRYVPEADIWGGDGSSTRKAVFR